MKMPSMRTANIGLQRLTLAAIVIYTIAVAIVSMIQATPTKGRDPMQKIANNPTVVFILVIAVALFVGVIFGKHDLISGISEAGILAIAGVVVAIIFAGAFFGGIISRKK